MELIVVLPFVLLLIGWVGSVVVLFSKGQTGWAVTGIVFGWGFPIPWIVAAAVTPNLDAIAETDRKRQHEEFLRRRRDNAKRLEERRSQERMLAAQADSAPAPPQADSAPAPDRSIDGRLETIDRLLREGKITQDEYADQRRAILRDI